jgi:NAD dependent epimerase/dehydratase family enzyme
MSWIHVDDLVRVMELALDDPALAGAVNAVSPNPERQRDFQRALAHALHRPFWMWIPATPLRIALGEMAELLVKGQRVAPRRLLERRFAFRYALLEDALADLVRRGRS